jgi:hypothetical protein
VERQESAEVPLNIVQVRYMPVDPDLLKRRDVTEIRRCGFVFLHWKEEEMNNPEIA